MTATTLVELCIYGKDFTMGDQFAQSTDDSRREMMSRVAVAVTEAVHAVVCYR